MKIIKSGNRSAEDLINLQEDIETILLVSGVEQSELKLQMERVLIEVKRVRALDLEIEELGKKLGGEIPPTATNKDSDAD